MTRDDAVIRILTLANALIGEKAFSEAWTSFLKELDIDEIKPIPAVPIDKNYSEDDEDDYSKFATKDIVILENDNDLLTL